MKHRLKILLTFIVIIMCSCELLDSDSKPTCEISLYNNVFYGKINYGTWDQAVIPISATDKEGNVELEILLEDMEYLAEINHGEFETNGLLIIKMDTAGIFKLKAIATDNIGQTTIDSAIINVSYFN